jgi:hypothetical protein
MKLLEHFKIFIKDIPEVRGVFNRLELVAGKALFKQ